MSDMNHGVRVTIIDFGLSRMNVEDPDTRASDTQFSAIDDAVFRGEGNAPIFGSLKEVKLMPELVYGDLGDYQFDIYRMMRKYNGDDWEKFTPFSNVLVSPANLSWP